MPCAIPDPDKGEVILTDDGFKTAVYSEDGWQRDLAGLLSSRAEHACSSFTHAGEKVLLIIINNNIFTISFSSI